MINFSRPMAVVALKNKHLFLYDMDILSTDWEEDELEASTIEEDEMEFCMFRVKRRR